MNRLVKDWDYDEHDYLRLLKDYVENRIHVETYRDRLFSMSSKRSLMADEASIVIQQAYGDADDYDPVEKLDYTIDESALRERVEKAVAELERLGYQVEEKA